MNSIPNDGTKRYVYTYVAEMKSADDNDGTQIDIELQLPKQDIDLSNGNWAFRVKKCLYRSPSQKNYVCTLSTNLLINHQDGATQKQFRGYQTIDLLNFYNPTEPFVYREAAVSADTYFFVNNPNPDNVVRFHVVPTNTRSVFGMVKIKLFFEIFRYN